MAILLNCTYSSTKPSKASSRGKAALKAKKGDKAGEESHKPPDRRGGRYEHPCSAYKPVSGLVDKNG